MRQRSTAAVVCALIAGSFACGGSVAAPDAGPGDVGPTDAGSTDPYQMVTAFDLADPDCVIEHCKGLNGKAAPKSFCGGRPERSNVGTNSFNSPGRRSQYTKGTAPNTNCSCSVSDTSVLSDCRLYTVADCDALTDCGSCNATNMACAWCTPSQKCVMRPNANCPPGGLAKTTCQ